MSVDLLLGRATSHEARMRFTTLITIFGAALSLSGCMTERDDRAFGQGWNDLGSSVSGGVGRDTYGTNRRPDVYGASTAPSLPSMGTPGLGK
jgi:hypothetical protein